MLDRRLSRLQRLVEGDGETVLRLADDEARQIAFGEAHHDARAARRGAADEAGAADRYVRHRQATHLAFVDDLDQFVGRETVALAALAQLETGETGQRQHRDVVPGPEQRDPLRVMREGR